MALAFTEVKDTQDEWGKTRVKVFDAAPAAADYATGGYPIAPSAVGLRTILGVKQIGGNPASGGVLTHWDTTNGKLMVRYPTGGGTIPAALAAPLITAGATGVLSAAANGASDLTAGIGAEVAAATDLSSHTYRLMFFGN